MFQCDCPPDDCAGKVQRYLQGDRGAGDDLARKFAPLVHSIVQRVLGPGRREEWEDACQAVFLHLFSNLDKWGNRCPFCKWLAVVAARRTIDLTRLAASPMDRLPAEEIADPRPAPPDPETLERLEQIVARFPPEWRQLWGWWVQGVPREEMASRLGKSLRTIQYRLAEMLDQVRQGLTAE
jgi:RNA polymerase sigma factor (sigma-70 family)